MMLIDQADLPAAALPVAAFREHLRLGTGFADDGAEDALIERVLRAAMAAVEARTGKALLARQYTWTLTAWRAAARQALPVAPVRDIASVTVIDRQGAEAAIPQDDYALKPDTHRPHLTAPRGALPAIPLGGSARVVFTAGFGPEWTAVPADLAQAVFLLAAQYYEHRGAGAGGDGGMPFGVATLLERWRTVRLLGAGA